jgi:hypothetical protein
MGALKSCDYESTLAALQGMLGRELNVQVCAARPGEEIPHATVAWLEGELRSGSDIRHPSTASYGEAMMFSVGNASTGFLLEPRTFESASWWTAGTFVIRTAGLVIVVNPGEVA